MIKLLVFAHVALFVITLFPRRGVEKIRTLAIPVGLAFLYTSAVQGWAAAHSLGIGLDLNDVRVALWVSLLSYLAFLLAYYSAKGSDRRTQVYFSDSSMDTLRLNGFGLLFFVAGALGYYLSIQSVGGWRAYLNLEDWSANLYETSGYIYMLKYASYAAVAFWLLSLALDSLPAKLHALLILLMLWLLFEAVQSTDRGDTIRASLPIVAWVYFITRKPRHLGKFVLWGNGIILLILLSVGMTVVLLPEFRDKDRSLLRSEVTLFEAVQHSEEKKGSSRGSESGGEFDTGARIIKRINAGEIHPPGPVHFARWIWNLVPRALVPEKHELFAQWAGPNYEAVRYGCISYEGCSSTGWAEAYGMMGWFGALVYWLALGFGVRRFEGWIGPSMVGFVVSAICYLPLIQLVMQDFWAGAMNASIVVVPVLIIFNWCRKQITARPTSARNAQARRHTPTQTTRLAG